MRPDDATQKESTTTTLQTIADTVRRIMRSDTASVAEFSLDDKTVMWKATSGFLTRAMDAPAITMPLSGNFLESMTSAEQLMILKGIGVRAELPVADFP